MHLEAELVAAQGVLQAVDLVEEGVVVEDEAPVCERAAGDQWWIEWMGQPL